MDKFEINPFNRSALTDSRLLAGRDDELKNMRFILRNSQSHTSRIRSTMICGDRGVGKTSFLNLIDAECFANNIIPVRLNLTSQNSNNSNEFFWFLFIQTLEASFKLDLLGGKNGDIDSAVQRIIYSNGIDDQMNWVFKTPILHKSYINNENSLFDVEVLIEDLKLIRHELKDSNHERYDEKTKFLFLVDESQNLYTNKALIEEIRYLVQNHDLGYGFVFAGKNSYEKSQWDTVFGGAHREFEIITLDYFKDVDSVRDYFRKSLVSVEWTKKDIESESFYRFNKATIQIHALTSGKPAWINEVAQKMFDRCMKGESTQLRFDRHAQNDVKEILLKSGEIDRNKIEFIDLLSIKYQKWLSQIFDCEGSDLRQVYFYSKFMLTGDYFLTIDQFTNFCKDLISADILKLKRSEEESGPEIIANKDKEKLLDVPFLVLGENSDSIKLWLQINSDGKFKFRYSVPTFTFIDHVNKELAADIGNGIVFASNFLDDIDESKYRISKIIQDIKDGTFDIEEIPYQSLFMIYKLVKVLDHSKNGEILYVILKDNLSMKAQSWNIYSTDEHDKIIRFNVQDYFIQKLVKNVESYNDDTQNYSLEISVDLVDAPSLKNFQNQIVKSDNSKKRGIVLEDKMNDLLDSYVETQNLELSFEIAEFILSVYNEGYDLNLTSLNNTAYVLMEEGNMKDSNLLLTEGMKKIKYGLMDKADQETAGLLIYNTGLHSFYEEQYSKALSIFKEVIRYCDDHEIKIVGVGALKIIERTNSKLILIEVIVNNHDKKEKIAFLDRTKENILVLEEHLKSK